MVGREARSRWPVGDGLESSVSVALSGEAERGAGCRRGDGAPGIALCPAVTPVSLCREPREEPHRGRSPGGPEPVPARVADWGFGGAGREAAEFPLGLTGCQSPPAPVQEGAKPATRKGMTLPDNFPSRTPDSHGLETAAARAI